MSARSALSTFRSRSRLSSASNTTTARANLPVVGEVSTFGLLAGVALLAVLFVAVSGGGGGRDPAPRVNIN